MALIRLVVPGMLPVLVRVPIIAWAIQVDLSTAVDDVIHGAGHLGSAFLRQASVVGSVVHAYMGLRGSGPRLVF